MRRFIQPVILTMPLCQYRGASNGCHQSQLKTLLSEIMGQRAFSKLENNTNAEDEYRHTWSVFEPSVMTCSFERRPWIYVLDMSGFKPGEISINVTDNVMVVSANHEETEGDNVDVIIRKRSVRIPEGVNMEKIACFLNRGGKFVITAPFSSNIPRGEKEKPTDHSTTENPCRETAKEKMSMVGNCQHGDEKSVSNIAENPCRETVKEWRCMDWNCLHGDEKAVSNLADKLEIESLQHEAQHDESVEDGQKTKVCEDVDQSTAELMIEPVLHDHRSSCSMSRANSPMLSGDFVILSENENGEDKFEQDTDDVEVVSQKHDHLEPLMDSTEITGEDQKCFLVKINLEQFPVDNISIRCQENIMFVDAKRGRELNDSGMAEFQEVHRQYLLPKNACEGEASALISDRGIVSIEVPLLSEHTSESKAILIQQ